MAKPGLPHERLMKSQVDVWQPASVKEVVTAGVIRLQRVVAVGAICPARVLF